MDIKVNKEKSNTYKVEVTVDKETVTKYLDEALKHEAEQIEVKGFRKGAAPISMVKETVDPAKLRSHALNHLIPEIYKRILAENKFAPIVGPRIELKQFEEGQDLILVINIVEKPDIKIGDYKKALIEAGNKKSQENKDKKPEEQKPFNNEDVINAILSISEIEVADVLVQEEVARMVSSLIDQTSKMGVTVDEYVKAHNKTIEQIREEYKKASEQIIKADFIITEIAAIEGVTINDEDVEAMINMVPDEQSKKQLENPEQKLYIKAILLKSKTLEKLLEYAVPATPKQVDTSDSSK